MANLSYKQEVFRDYLIERLGFDEDDVSFLSGYLIYLDMVQLKYNVLFQNYLTQSNENQDIGEYSSEPAEFGIIDFLLMEVNIRRSRFFEVLYERFEKITATDVANFTFCPVSYAISKSFQYGKPDSALRGTGLHDKQILTSYLSEFKINEDCFNVKTSGWHIENLYNKNNLLFFEEVKNAKCLFSGHTSEKKYFTSKLNNLYMQPDYIFQKVESNEIFVVEKKFHFVENIEENKNNTAKTESISRTNFFDSHKNQVLTYIYGIANYNIKYGYLVYWDYEIRHGEPNIVSCSILRIDKNLKNKTIIVKKFNELKDVIKDKRGDFNINNRKSKKCANCVTNILCGHKTGKYAAYSLPYSENYFRLKNIEFPAILQRENPKKL